MSSLPHPTNEFAREFEAETSLLLRHRFWWFLCTTAILFIFFRSLWIFMYGVFATGQAVGGGVQMLAERAMEGVRFGHFGAVLVGLLTICDLAALITAGVWASRHRPTPTQQLKLTMGLLVYLSISHIAAMTLLNSVGFPWVIMAYHFAACVFLPWTPMQALRPIVPVIALNAIAILLFRDASITQRLVIIALSLLAAFPGIANAAIRHSRRAESFRIKMLQTRYGQMKRELFDARRIHEALFPPPIQSGPLRFEYRYQPMLQIGGDYLYARFSPSIDDADPAFNILLLDVTGHGIAAALTVNRLYGEVERLFAEDPHAGPGDVLLALNRYVHLTLANHSIYVTALCIRIDQEQSTLEYASGGHPPAFLCDASGRIHQLDSTAFVLGAAAGPDFDPAVQSRPFGPGDTLLAYTDGALECRNHQGRMLGVKGLSSLISGRHGPHRAGESGLAADLLKAVESHRHGPPEDDTLIVEITRSADLPAPPIRIDSARERTTIGV